MSGFVLIRVAESLSPKKARGNRYALHSIIETQKHKDLLWLILAILGSLIN